MRSIALFVLAFTSLTALTACYSANQPERDMVLAEDTVNPMALPLVEDFFIPDEQTDPITSKILFPDGGEVFVVGQTYELLWDSEEAAFFNLELHSMGINQMTFAENIKATVGTYTWTPAADLLAEEDTKSFSLVILDSETGTPIDISDSFVVVAEQTE